MLWQQQPSDRAPIDATSTELQDKLELFRPIYLKSKARIDGEDEAWNEKKKFLEQKVYGLLKSYSGEDSAHKAVLIIGQTQSIVAELDGPRMNVAQVEGMKRQFEAETERIR